MGPGAGKNFTLEDCRTTMVTGYGGTHGGQGGRSCYPSLSDPGFTLQHAQPYGDFRMPRSYGSGGGPGWSPTKVGDEVGPGGAGGGIMDLTMASLMVGKADAVTANGANAPWGDATRAYGGGGSGGSVLLHAARVYGPGSVTCNGGGGRSNSYHGKTQQMHATMAPSTLTRRGCCDFLLQLEEVAEAV